MTLEADLAVISEVLSSLKRGPHSWKQLSQKTKATPSQFNRILQFLRKHGYIEKRGPTGSRSTYKVTNRGAYFYDLLPAALQNPLPKQTLSTYLFQNKLRFLKRSEDFLDGEMKS